MRLMGPLFTLSGYSLKCMECNYREYYAEVMSDVEGLNAWAETSNDESCKNKGPFTSANSVSKVLIIQTILAEISVEA